MSGNFIALDISVRSTGWVRYVDKVLSFGTYKLMAQDDRQRRREFADFLVQLFAENTYEFIVVEDVIFGNNFETTKILMQLNVIVEDLMDSGTLQQTTVYRIGNTVWKKRLYQLANITNSFVKCAVDDKKCIRDALHSMSFDVNDTYAQDIYDALGLGLACIADKHSTAIVEDALTSVKCLHTDLHKCYKFVQYPDLDTLRVAAQKKLKRSKRYKSVIEVSDCTKYSTLAKHFKDVVVQNGEEHIFAIAYDLNKVGSVLLTKAFELSVEQTKVYFLAYLR